MVRIRLCAMLAALACACGGSSFDGSVSGTELEVEDALLISGATADGAFVHVHLTDRTGVCEDARGGRQPHGMTSFILEFPPDARGKAAAGEYSIARPGAGLMPVDGHAAALFYKTDDRCGVLVEGVGVSGSVTLDSIDSDVAEGSFDVVFDTGDHATGDFEAEACAGAQTSAMTCD